MNRFFKYTKILLIAILCFGLSLIVVACGEKDCQHNWLNATCSAPKTCTRCGETEGTVKEHIFGDWNVISEPTCTKQGGKSHVCSVCGKIEIEAIPMVNHSYAITANFVEHVSKCKNCDYSETSRHSMGSDMTCSVCHGSADQQAGMFFLPYGDGLALSGLSEEIANSSLHTTLTIPDTYKNKPVVCVSQLSSANVQQVVFGNNVTEIGDRAFYGMEKLTSINIPARVSKIGYGAFHHCYSLTSAAFEKETQLTVLPANLFDGCSSLECFDIPDSVIEIGDYCFSSSGIKSIEFPSTVTKIGIDVIFSCADLENIYFEDVTTITQFGGLGGNLFNLDGIYINDLSAYLNTDRRFIENRYAQKLYVNNQLITNLVVPADVPVLHKAALSINSIESIVIPATVTKIEDGAVSDNNGLKTVVFENDSAIDTISQSAFADCLRLESVTLPSNVTKIEGGAFINTPLKKLEIPASLNYIGHHALPSSMDIYVQSVDQWTNMSFETEVSNPLKNGGSLYCNNQLVEEVYINSEKVGYAFAGSTIKKVTFGPDVKNISAKSFENTQLTSLYIPANVMTIGEEAFMSNRLLEKIEFQQGTQVKVLPARSFAGCEKLKTVIFANGLEEIVGAFNNCNSLETITIPASVTNINNAFSRCEKLTTVIFEQNSNMKNMRYAFSSCPNLKNVTIPAGTQDISDAFSQCYALEKISVPGSVTITDSAFYGCESLTQAETQSTSFERYMFAGCTNLKQIEIPQGTQKIDEAFNNCWGLTGVFIPSSVVSLERSFTNCKNLKIVEFQPGSQLTYIGGAFENCTSLESVAIPDKVQELSYAFFGCTNLHTVTFGRNSQLKLIVRAAFQASGIKNIQLPDTVEEIGGSAFWTANSLEKIVIPTSVKQISSNAFYSCANLKEVVFKQGTEFSANVCRAFQYCNLDSIVVPYNESGDNNCNSYFTAETIYFAGSEQQWQNCQMSVVYQEIYFYSASQPTTEGNWWHYVDGVVTKW